MARHTIIFYNDLVKNKKLSARLNQIISFVPDDSEKIWDICCDHGHVGRHFLPESNVVFIDQVKSIVKKLEQTLSSTDINKGQYEVILKSASEYEYPSNTIKNCFIMVGIGADLLIKILEKIPYNPADVFIVCAHQYSFRLRHYLHTSAYKLDAEVLLGEQGKVYEILKLNHQGTRKTSLIGEDFWIKDDSVALGYLEDQIKYFTIKTKYDNQYSKVFQDYLKISKFLKL